MRHVGDLFEKRQLNDKIQYELQEFKQLNYESFVHEFTKIAVSFIERSKNFIIIGNLFLFLQF